MSVMIQIRNVPDDLHRELKVRAARNGATLSDYLLGELEALSARPTMREWLQDASSWPTVDYGESPAQAIRASRAGR